MISLRSLKAAMLAGMQAQQRVRDEERRLAEMKEMRAAEQMALIKRLQIEKIRNRAESQMNRQAREEEAEDTRLAEMAAALVRRQSKIA